MLHNILITSAGKRVALTRYFKETLNRFYPDAKVFTTDMPSCMAPAGYASDGVRIGLITDGRSVQQRNKIEALGLLRWIDENDTIISEEFGSEKPTTENYLYLMKRYPDCHDFTYVGDNVKKDFIAPNALGWNSICLRDDGRNIHKQGSEELATAMKPKRWIESFAEVIDC